MQSIGEILSGMYGVSTSEMANATEGTSALKIDEQTDRKLQICPECGTPIEKRITIFGKKRIVPVMCECRIREKQELEEERRLETIEENRDRCFENNRGLQEWRLEDCVDKSPKLLQLIYNYVNSFDDVLHGRNGFLMNGLLIVGGSGTGKSTLLAGIANAVVDQGFSVKYTSIIDFATRMQSFSSDRLGVLSEVAKPSLLIIDDLGSERKSDYMQEITYQIIDRRYQSKKPIVIGSRLGSDILQKEDEPIKRYIYDRIFEMCFPIELKDIKIRNKVIARNFEATKRALFSGTQKQMQRRNIDED